MYGISCLAIQTNSIAAFKRSILVTDFSAHVKRFKILNYRLHILCLFRFFYFVRRILVFTIFFILILGIYIQCILQSPVN